MFTEEYAITMIRLCNCASALKNPYKLYGYLILLAFSVQKITIKESNSVLIKHDKCDTLKNRDAF
jgi:hypothetical protein